MKNKTKTYLLLALVLTIWGLIGFKVLSTINPNITKINIKEELVFTPRNNVVQDTFSIKTAVRDPFLGTIHVKKKVLNKTEISNHKEILIWIPIIYHGMVSKKEGKEKIYVVSIEGQQSLIKIGQDIGGVKLLSATNSEIVVSYRGKKKAIPKL